MRYDTRRRNLPVIQKKLQSFPVIAVSEDSKLRIACENILACKDLRIFYCRGNILSGYSNFLIACKKFKCKLSFRPSGNGYSTQVMLIMDKS